MSHFSTTEHQALADVQLTDAERQPCEVWTRVMGYHRPVASFNIGKQGEHPFCPTCDEERLAAKRAALAA